MKNLVLLFALLPIVQATYCQKKTDTIFLEYTPKEKTLEKVEVVAQSNTRLLNDRYTKNSEACWRQMNPGDTVFDTRSGMREKDLYDFLRKHLPGFDGGGMMLVGPRGGMNPDVPRYNGQELAIFLDQKAVGMKDIDNVRGRTIEYGMVKFIKNFKCTTGSGPAILVYTRLLIL